MKNFNIMTKRFCVRKLKLFDVNSYQLERNLNYGDSSFAIGKFTPGNKND